MSRSDAPGPRSLSAEREVIGSCLTSRVAVERMLAELVPEDFCMPWHGEVVAAIRTLVSGGFHVDHAAVVLELGKKGIAKRNPTFEADLVSMSIKAATQDPRRFVGEVSDCASRRRNLVLLRQLAEDMADMDTPLSETSERARTFTGSIEMPVLAGKPDMDLAEFLAGGVEYDWLVPGLLETGDRCLLTGEEGGGKSLWLRQVAVSLAAGMHPFTFAPVDPLRVMILDLENSRGQSWRWLGRIQRAVGIRGFAVGPGMLRLVIRPEGLDLAASGDVRWLYERLESNRPQVVIGGPLYKMAVGDGNKEENAAQVARVLDVARSRWGFALMLEAHSPHAQGGASRDLRPLGSSLWRRWPEFGMGIAYDRNDPKSAALRSWRGARDEREWPRKLRRGGDLPWVPETRPVPNQPDAELLPGPDQRSDRHARY